MHRCGRGVNSLVMAVHDEAEARAHETDHQGDPEGLEQPRWVDEVNHLRRVGAALRVETWLLAGGLGWFGHWCLDCVSSISCVTPDEKSCVILEQ